MRILLNLSKESKIYINEGIDFFDLVLSHSKTLNFKNNQTFKKIIYFNSILEKSILMNQYFWFINVQKDFYKKILKINKIIIYYGKDKNLNEYHSIPDIEFYNRYIVINNCEYIRTPTYSFYDKSDLYDIEKYLEVWLSFIQNKFLITEKNNFLSDKKISEFREKIMKNKNFINSGNEGILLWKNDRLKVKKKVPINESNCFDNANLYKNHIVEYCQNELIPFFYEDSELEIKVIKDKKYINFIYTNFVLPLNIIDFARMARLLIRQRKTSIFIDDNKIINYGKIIIKNTPFFEIIYNDFGNSFIKTENKNFQEGLIRDVYFLVENYYRIDQRSIISSKRSLPIKDILEKNKNFSIFFNFVINQYKHKDADNGMPMVCHEPYFLKNIDIYNEVYTCSDTSTMNRLICYKDGKRFVYEMKTNKVHECNGKFINNEFELNGFEKELSINLEIIDGATKWIRK